MEEMAGARGKSSGAGPTLWPWESPLALLGVGFFVWTGLNRKIAETSQTFNTVCSIKVTWFLVIAQRHLGVYDPHAC